MHIVVSPKGRAICSETVWNYLKFLFNNVLLHLLFKLQIRSKLTFYVINRLVDIYFVEHYKILNRVMMKSKISSKKSKKVVAGETLQSTPLKSKLKKAAAKKDKNLEDDVAEPIALKRTEKSSKIQENVVEVTPSNKRAKKDNSKVQEEVTQKNSKARNKKTAKAAAEIVVAANDMPIEEEPPIANSKVPDVKKAISGGNNRKRKRNNVVAPNETKKDDDEEPSNEPEHEGNCYDDIMYF